MQEVGTYLRSQVKANNLKVSAVTAQAGVAPNYITRIRKGEIQNPPIENIKALTEAAQADWAEVRRLLEGNPQLAALDELVNAEVAKALASEKASRSTDQAERARDIIARLRFDPDRFDAWLREGDLLLGGTG